MFKYIYPEIIIVDDVIEEVEGIINFFKTEGIGYKYYNANISDGDIPPEESIPGVKLVFLDLFYKDDFDVEICTNWITSIVQENSYYGLVLWTKDTQYEDEIKNEFGKEGRSPLFCISKQKTDYRLNQNDLKFKELIDDIEKEIDNIIGLKELFNWQRSIHETLHKLIYFFNQDIENPIHSKLQSIIKAEGGEIINEYTPEMRRDILFNALDNLLPSNSAQNRNIKFLSNNDRDNIYTNIIGNHNNDSLVNSWFIFQQSPVLNTESISAGTLFHITDEDIITDFSLTSDNQLKKFFTFQSIPSNSDIDIKHIALLITPACNLSQKKTGNLFIFLYGIFLSTIKRTPKGKIFSGTLPESVKFIDHINIKAFNNKIESKNSNHKNDDGLLLFDFRYIFSLPIKSFNKKMAPIAVLSKNVLSDFQASNSAYLSRIGYTKIE